MIRFQFTRWVLASAVVSISYGVVGGTQEAALKYDRTGALVTRPFGTPVLGCTASLIAPRVLITAAHCVAAWPAQPLEFTVSADALSVGHSSVLARRAFVNPAYDLRANGRTHDIALIELDAPLKGLTAERVLDPSEAAAVLRPGVHVEIVGYGRTGADGGLLGKKNAADATITSVGIDEMTIGRPGEAQNCAGDSGGPAFFVGADGTRRLISIVSRSANDATDCVDGSIHIRLDAYADWIATTLHTIAADFQRSK